MNGPQVIGQLIRFAGMGVVNSAIYMMLATVFSGIFGIATLAASVSAYAIAAAVAYLGHKFLTFGTPANAPCEIARFVVASGIGLSLAALIPILLADLAPLISSAAVLVLVPVCSFLMMKLFVFRA